VTSPADTLPLWARVLEDLRSRIDAGEFDTRFPGDLELVAHYQVSRHTVREAVRHLQAEGVLERRRGRGSFITRVPIEQPIGTLYSLFRSIEANGMTQDSVVRHLRRRHDDKAAAMLGCPGQALVYLERVRLADKEPVALDCSWLPASLAEPLLDVDFHHTALYEQLATRCGIRLTSGWERIRPVLPDRTQRELLDIDPREPAFGIERMAYRDDSPVEWRHSVVRGDCFSFVARWAKEQQDTTFEPTAAG
jgi:GntR family transcriptional regulator